MKQLEYVLRACFSYQSGTISRDSLEEREEEKEDLPQGRVLIFRSHVAPFELHGVSVTCCKIRFS